jgi:hypothetical protein
MFEVRTVYNGKVYFLRNTIWTEYADRATRFESAEKARAGLDKARKFMKAATFKAATVVEFLQA